MNTILDEIMGINLHEFGCGCKKCRHQSEHNIFDEIWDAELDDELSSAQVNDAVRYNNNKAQSVGWVNHRHDIVEKVLKLNYTPEDWAFAQAVADWQRRNGLVADGMLGPTTWRRMQNVLYSNSNSSFPDFLPVGGRIDPQSCVQPNGSRTTESVNGGKIYSEYMIRRSGGIHLGIDVSTSGSGDSKNDIKRGTPVFAKLRSVISIQKLRSACVATASGTYVRGLSVDGVGNATLQYASVRIPGGNSHCKGGYGCSGDSAYGGVVGLACVYSYRKSDGSQDNFTLFLEYLHLILPNYLPYYKSGRTSYKMSMSEWSRHPNVNNIGFGPMMTNENRLNASQLTSGHLLVGYFGSTTWPHVHIQAAFSHGIRGYVRHPRFDPMIMIL